MLRTTLATVLCLVGLSLAAPARPTTSPARLSGPAPTTIPSKYLGIVHIVSRDKTVTVSSGPQGLVYSLAMNDGGKVLVANATGAQFEKLQPELYRSIRGDLAVKNNNAFLWDGVETTRSQDHPDAPFADASVDNR